MKNLVIVGAGDLGKELVWLIEDINRLSPTYLILGFLDDNNKKTGNEFYGYRVLGNSGMLEELAERNPFSAVIAIQDGSIRKKIVDAHPGFHHWESIVHPSAVISSSSPLGVGSIVFPHVTISVDSRIGRFDLFYIHATVCNDCQIGDYVSVMSGASVSEHAEIGDEAFLAAGSIVYPHRKLGKNVKVGVEATASVNYSEGSEVCENRTEFTLFK